METNLIANPTAAHVDPWEITLIAASALGAGLSLAGVWRQQHLGRDHFFRFEVERHFFNAGLASAAYLAVAAIAHGLGWAVWGTVLFGLVGLAILLITALLWRWSFLPMLRRHERSNPVPSPSKKRPGAARHLRRPQYPWLVGIASGGAAYTALVWHPWNHIFHMGMWLVAPLIGYAVASLVAAETVDVVRLERSLRESPARVRPRRHRG